MASLDVTFVARDRTVWTGEAEMLSIPAADGYLGVLPGMVPTLTTLAPGTVSITLVGGGKREIAVDGGFASIDENTVTLTVDTVVREHPVTSRK
jgi:F-type H+-transporting ATPase subunit epsilon